MTLKRHTIWLIRQHVWEKIKTIRLDTCVLFINKMFNASVFFEKNVQAVQRQLYYWLLFVCVDITFYYFYQNKCKK